MPGIPSLDNISDMLMGDANNSAPVNNYVSTASAGINNQTNEAVKKLMAKFATTGMNRSGISGVALNDAYKTGGQELNNVAAQGEMMQQQQRTQAIQQLLGISQYEDQKPGIMDYLGSVLGQVGGMAAGAGTSDLMNKFFGGSSNTGSSNNNSYPGINMTSPNVSASSYGYR